MYRQKGSYTAINWDICTADGKDNNEGFKIWFNSACTVVVTLLCNFLLDDLLSKGL